MRTSLLFILLLISGILGAQGEYFSPQALEGGSIVFADTLLKSNQSFRDTNCAYSLYRHRSDILICKTSEGQLKAWRFNSADDITEIDCHDFNGGWPEVIITSQFISGHSGWQGGLSEQYETKLFIDLQHEKVLLHLDTYIETEMWWQELDQETMDSLGTDTLIILDGGTDHFCDQSEVTIRDSIIEIRQNPNLNCEGIDPEEHWDPYTLVWRKDAFYLKD